MTGTKKLEVALVVPQDKGGLLHYAAELANALATKHEVHIFKASNTSIDSLFHEKVNVHNSFKTGSLDIAAISDLSLNIRDTLSSSFSYNNISNVDKVSPDVVHFTSPTELSPFLRIFTKYHGLDKRYPIIETYHNVHPREFIRRGKYLDPSEPFSIAAAYNIKNLLETVLPKLDRERAIVHTDSNAATLKQWGYKPDSINVVPHGAYTIFGGGDYKRVEGKRVLFFGNIVPSKGLDVAVKSIKYVNQTHGLSPVLVIAGKGDISSQSMEIIENNPSLFEIHNEFVPNREVEELFRESSIIAMPHRRQEGHSGTMTVAFSHSKPMVATNVGDYSKFLSKSGAGIVVTKDDHVAFGEGLHLLLENPQIQKIMGKNSGEMAEMLDWGRVGERHTDIYEQAIQSHKSVKY